MLFSEIYGSYFQVVSTVLTRAAEGGLTDRELTELVSQKAFAESGMTIPSALKKGEWPLLCPDRTTVLQHKPTVPLTLLQRRWLKALLLDPRIALFEPDGSGLEDVEPLYRPDTFVYFDRYSDGDPYGDPVYRDNFKTVLRAIRERKALRVRFRGHTGLRHSFVCRPYRLEYSAKDDKFRILASGQHDDHTVNLGRVRSCVLLEPHEAQLPEQPRERSCELTLLLHDERNGLERVLLHFSHLEKETVRLEDDLYRITLRYDRDDETELLIRVLSFGPVLEVVGPDRFIDLVKARLAKQMRLTGREVLCGK